MKFQLFTLINRKGTASDFMLTPLELKDYLDFEVKRVYFISDSKGGETGQHAHFVEKELFIMVRGLATAIIDKGNGREEIKLEGPKNAIYVPNFVWHGFKNLSKDAIILALSSTNYNPERKDYIENYEEYLSARDESLSK